ncbi:unannotated protein [freshwater metagenome]|uniref:Unannotated protein n=1 Tax=freshwater metagenome TaxID=449393 RepID=A0A6J6G6A4_9ZZZZ
MRRNCSPASPTINSPGSVSLSRAFSRVSSNDGAEESMVVTLSAPLRLAITLNEPVYPNTFNTRAPTASCGISVRALRWSM